MKFVINAKHEQFPCSGACTCAILHDVPCESQQISQMTLVALRRLLQRLHTTRSVRDMTTEGASGKTYVLQQVGGDNEVCGGDEAMCIHTAQTLCELLSIQRRCHTCHHQCCRHIHRVKSRM